MTGHEPEPYGHDTEADEDLGAPLSFKIMIVLVVLYLGVRLVEGVVWVFNRLFG